MQMTGTAGNLSRAAIVLAGLLCGLPARGQKALFSDAFLPDSLKAWTVKKDYTAAEVSVAATGQLSPTSVEIRKPDCAGSLSLTKRVAVPAGHYLRLSLDIQSLFVGPFAQYLMSITTVGRDGKAIGEPQSFPFDDGITPNSAFGGVNKTPQTLGQWQKTRHVFKTDASAAELAVAILFKEGKQQVRIDNFLLEDLGSNAPAKITNPAVYARQIHSAGVAMLTLDMLLPGYSYDVQTLTDTLDHQGMGISMRWRNYQGELSDPVQLVQTGENGKALSYRLEVPYRATQVLLSLNNTDLARIGYYQGPKYRNWRQIQIYPLGELSAPDVIYYHNVQKYGDDLDLIRPPELVEVTGFDKQVLVQHLNQRTADDAEVKCINGGMVFLVGGRMYPPFFSGWNYNQVIPGKILDCYSELAKRGIRFVRVNNLEGGPAMNGQWLGLNRYDFSRLDDQLLTALKLNPDAYIILDLRDLNAPLWWGDAHPDQIIQNPEGLACGIYGTAANSKIWGKMAGGALGRAMLDRHKDGVWSKNMGYTCPVSYLASPASLSFRRDLGHFLTALRRHIESQPYGKAVIGYKTLWGYDSQWNWPDQANNEIVGKSGPAPEQMMDYSPAMVAYFRNFLRDKYRTTDQLRRAWNNPNVTFETAAIPRPEERRERTVSGKPSNLLDPATRRPVIDYNTCYNSVLGDMISDVGETIKAAVPRKVITTAYFQEDYRDMGHSLMLRRGGLDISGGPYYSFREVGQSGLDPHLCDSYRLHGKISFIEFDYRLFTQAYRVDAGTQFAETTRKSISVIQREFGRQMCTGEGGWLYDMSMGWFSHPIIADALGQVERVWQTVLNCDRSSPAQMAVFFGDYVMRTQSLVFADRNSRPNSYLRGMMAQAGVPVDVYRLDDLPAVKSRYKVFIFPNATGLTDADRKAIDSLKKDGNVLVFGSAAGFIGSDRQSAANVETLVGMNLRQADNLTFITHVTNSTHPITQDLTGYIGGENWEHERFYYPMFYVTDSKAVALGEFTGPEGSGKTAFAVKDCGGWQSVYLGSAGFWPGELFRGLARFGKLHIYSNDGDVMYFAKSLVALHASSDGTKTITLPEPRQVRSLWDNQDLGRVQTIVRPMHTGDNAMYLLTK